MAAVPDDENLRVLSRAKKASNQLRTLSSTQDSGVLSIGLNESQRARVVLEHIHSKVKRGRFRGIAAFLLLRRATFLQLPCRTTVDLYELVKNPNATPPLPGDLLLRPLHGAAHLTQSEPYIGGITAYRLAKVSCQFTNPAAAFALMPDIRVLTRDLIV